MTERKGNTAFLCRREEGAPRLAFAGDDVAKHAATGTRRNPRLLSKDDMDVSHCQKFILALRRWSSSSIFLRSWVTEISFSCDPTYLNSLSLSICRSTNTRKRPPRQRLRPNRHSTQNPTTTTIPFYPQLPIRLILLHYRPTHCNKAWSGSLQFSCPRLWRRGSLK